LALRSLEIPIFVFLSLLSPGFFTHKAEFVKNAAISDPLTKFLMIIQNLWNTRGPEYGIICTHVIFFKSLKKNPQTDRISGIQGL
jgi:hypothetical protein